MGLDVDDTVSDHNAGGAVGRRLRVGVAGLGVIGEGTALQLAAPDSPYAFSAALVRDRTKPRPSLSPDVGVHDDPGAFLNAPLDMVIDALPDGPVGYALIKAALARGIGVVSANKQALAGRLAELHGTAKQHCAVLVYAASVGGGAPMIETVRRVRAACGVRSVTAILNGTVNFILTEVAAGGAFQDAVKSAQAAGFAEPDPAADLSGEDARAKIAILSYEAFGEEIDLEAIEIEALDKSKAADFAKAGGVWKQLARIEASGDRLAARVGYERVDSDPFLRDVAGEGNALRVTTDDGETHDCTGKGAGRDPTVDSIFADLKAVRNAG